MKAIVMGMGLQGKAVIHDLEASELITEILAADLFPTDQSLAEANAYLKQMGYGKTTPLRLDVLETNDLHLVFTDARIDIVICMLPIELALATARAAVEAGIPFVSSNYTYDLSQLDGIAKQKQVPILPEMGLDPGIDLILGRLAIDQLETVDGMYSYGGGIPAPDNADTSPIRYKISWIFNRVLDVYVREARQIKDGRLHVVPGDSLFTPSNVHEIQFPDIGAVEAYPNGDAVRYVDHYGLGDGIQEMGRFALRWPGHAAFWRKMVALGLLDDQPIEGSHTELSPRAFIANCLTPKLQYQPDERDLALIRVEAWGLKAGERVKVTYDCVDYRDLETGLFAMNRTVGFTSSIGALMILEGQVPSYGVLSPVRHVPPQLFIDQIKARGIRITSKIEVLT
jgi:saccharopine dehydrogenase-like NADP-dependent oxidoreductase